MKSQTMNGALVESLMRSIEKGDLGTAYSLVKELQDVNISEPERKGKLPKIFHQIASSCLTTPMRMCISWRQLQLLEDLFSSRCIITQKDKNLGLQKILSYTKRELGTEEIQIIRILIKNGAIVNDVSHLANALYLAFDRNEEVFRSLMDVFIEEGSNTLKGSLLLALYLRDRNHHPNRVLAHPSTVTNIATRETSHEQNLGQVLPDREETDRDENSHSQASSPSDPDIWDNEVKRYIMKIYLSGFNPGDFLWNSDIRQGDIGRLVQALPHMLQLSPTVDNFKMGFILRKIARYFPLINVESTSVLKLLCELLIYLGYDISLVNDVAKCPKKFNKVLGFSRAEEHPRMLTLQERCRVNIRASVRSSNILLGVQELGLPEKLKRYIMLQDLFDFQRKVSP